MVILITMAIHIIVILILIMEAPFTDTTDTGTSLIIQEEGMHVLLTLTAKAEGPPIIPMPEVEVLLTQEESGK